MTGDTFYNVTNSTIVNRSLVNGAVNRLERDGSEDSAEAMKRLAEIVEQAGNSDATDYFNTFAEEVDKPEPRKSILQSMWQNLTLALPTLTQTAELAGSIESLIQGS